MSAGSLNIAIEQGTTWAYTLTWKVGGVAVNLSGYTARMQLRRTVVSDVAISLTTENGGITLGGSEGTIVLSMSEVETAALDAGDYVYDLELVSGNGVVERLVEGFVEVRAEVTR